MDINSKLKEGYENAIKALKEEHRAEIDALKAAHAAEVAGLLQQIEALKEAIATLAAKIAELEAKGKKDSTNSDNPPSSDGPKKRYAASSLREKTGRPSGGQKGHEGATLELSDAPDYIVELKQQEQCECGGPIIVQTDSVTVRQVTDIQMPKKVVVEYRGQDGICERCGKAHKASFPESAKGTAAYGPEVQSALTYLTQHQLLPMKRAAEIMKDMFGLNVSQGTIIKSSQDVYEKLEGPAARIRDEIASSDVAGFDESGMRVSGSQYWLHSASTPKATFYTIHKSRGKEGMDAQGILPVFRGTAIHDHWKAYYHYMCAHGECNAHHLRHLKFLYEVLGQEWAGEMACLLLRAKRHVELCRLFGSGELPMDDINEYERMYRAILGKAALLLGMPDPYASDGEGAASTGNAPAKKGKKTEPERMVLRLAKYEQETLLFMYDFSVPFDNNGTEQSIRMPKLKQKISGCFRTVSGAEVFARIRSYTSTVKKKGGNVYDGIKAALRGDGGNFLYSEKT